MGFLFILALGISAFFLYRWRKQKKDGGSRGEIYLTVFRKNGRNSLIRASSRQAFIDWYNSHPGDDPIWDEPEWKGVEKIGVSVEEKILSYI